MFDKLEGADFKFDNSFFKLQPKNTQIKYFWPQIYEFSILKKKFTIRKIRGR